MRQMLVSPFGSGTSLNSIPSISEIPFLIFSLFLRVTLKTLSSLCNCAINIALEISFILKFNPIIGWLVNFHQTLGPSLREATSCSITDFSKRSFSFVIRPPPSPAVIILLSWKLNIPASPIVASFLPLYSPPQDCALSSKTVRP